MSPTETSTLRGQIAVLQEKIKRNEKKLQAMERRRNSTAFMAKVQEYQRQHSCSEGQAVSACVDIYPDLHAQLAGSV